VSSTTTTKMSQYIYLLLQTEPSVIYINHVFNIRRLSICQQFPQEQDLNLYKSLHCFHTQQKRGQLWNWFKCQLTMPRTLLTTHFSISLCAEAQFNWFYSGLMYMKGHYNHSWHNNRHNNCESQKWQTQLMNAVSVTGIVISICFCCGKYRFGWEKKSNWVSNYSLSSIIWI
jgi:hypothetical protein